MRGFIVLSLFCFKAIFCQSNNKTLRDIRFLLEKDNCNEVIVKLHPFLNKIQTQDHPLYIEYLRALELCNHNENALSSSVWYLKNTNLTRDDKARLYILNARIYEKIGDKNNTKLSLDTCIKQLTANSPKEIIQIWNVRMASYYRIMTTEKDSARYYAKKAEQLNCGEVGSAFFLNAYLTDNLDEKIRYLKKSVYFYDSIKNTGLLGLMYVNLANIYKKKIFLQEYKQFANKGLVILEKEKSPEFLSNYYELKANFLFENKDYKNAYIYKDSSIIASKKIDSFYNKRELSILEQKYDQKSNENHINNINNLLKEKNKNNKMLLILIVILSIFIILIFIFSSLLKKKNKKLLNSIKYNSLLIKETNHRVKNNLMLLSGIIKIEISKSDYILIKEKLYEIEGRVNSISYIHKYIYQFDNYNNLNTANIVKDIVDNQKQIINSEFSNHIELFIDPVDIDVFRITPVVLIINELLTNSIKYALLSSSDYIKIILKTYNSNIEVSVIDSGQGYDFSPENQNINTGLYLIKILTQQLNGKLFHSITEKEFQTQLIFSL